MAKKRINYEVIINRRFVLFLLIILVLFSVIMVKFTSVMLINNKKYEKELSVLNYSEVYGTSSPRGRIYDRNYNIIVDNKSLKTITYQKDKKTSSKEMIETASILSNHISIDYSRLTDRNKREYICGKDQDYCQSLITKKDREQLKQRKITQKDINEYKINRISEDKLALSEEEQKIAYIYYLMNKGYTYEEKIIKSDVTDEEYAYVSENINSRLLNALLIAESNALGIKYDGHKEDNVQFGMPIEASEDMRRIK